MLNETIPQESMFGETWTDQEIIVLMTDYCRLGAKRLEHSGQLPGRTEQAIQRKARRMKLKYYGKTRREKDELNRPPKDRPADVKKDIGFNGPDADIWYRAVCGSWT